MGDISGRLDTEVVSHCVKLWLSITGVSWDPAHEDIFSWPKSPPGLYTTKPTYIALCQGLMLLSAYIEFKGHTQMQNIYVVDGPIKVLDFEHEDATWAGRVDHCFTCLQEEDMANHIKIQCLYAHEVWFRVFYFAHLVISPPGLNPSLFRGCWISDKHKERKKAF
jgi:hypothetical protein